MHREHWLLPDEPHPTYGAYLESVGSSAIERARAMDPKVILDEVLHSGLRGRGGAGFPTGVKWRTLHDHPCRERSVVCNAAEGEPGTFKDRYLLRRSPYPCLEGMIIAARVIGARRMFLGIKASFTLELERLRAALGEMASRGHLDDLDLEIVEGPGEYLFGEEKALLRYIEDGIPLPREAERPPYEEGLFASAASPNPALVNNVETFAHVPSIVRAGGASFRELGTHDTPGTVILTLSGDVTRPCVIEVEAGRPLREVLDEHAGGATGGGVRLVRSGVSTAPILADKLDTPVDFGSLALIGSGLGSGGFVVVSEARNVPRVAQSVARFLYVESCNQCTACKHGLRTTSKAIDELFDPELATLDDVERALFGARSAPQGNRCYLPVQGSILIPALMKRFAADFQAQLADPGRASEIFPIPLLIDYDEERGVFVYDERWVNKRPDWSFGEEPVGKPLETVPPTEALAVHLKPDLATALLERAREDDRPLDTVVDEILRERMNLPE